jgi:NADPH2:quinone reductase
LSSSKKGRFARLRFSSGAIDESKIVGEKKTGYEVRNVLGLSHVGSETAKPFWDRVEDYLRNGSLVPLRHEVVDGLDVEKVNEILDRYRDRKKVAQTQFRVSK